MTAAGEPASLAWRALRLGATGRATPDRVRTVVARQLDQGGQPTAADVIAALEEALAPLPPQADVAQAGRALSAAGADVRVVGEPGYPARLAAAWPELGAPVWLVATVADERAFGLPAVAVVGTRRPTLDGRRTARDLGRLLARSGVTVVSGMARGIDQEAHLGALDGGGPTLAVLGTGLAVDYPRGDGALRAAVARSGAVLTEHATGAGPRPVHFLWRNRIISGLSDATVVVEGGSRSGALQTARLAAAQGREVLAVPGSINAPASRAPLDLLRDGATPVTRLRDVCDAIGVTPVGPSGTTSPRLRPPLGGDTETVRGLLGAVPASPRDLAVQSGLRLPQVLAALAELDAAGWARPSGSGYIAGPAGPPLAAAAGSQR